MIDAIPSRAHLLVGAAVLVVASAFAGAVGWVANGWRLDAAHRADIAQRDAQLAAAKDLARLREQDWNKQRNEAIDNANSRDQIIRTLAAGSAGASLSLRDTLAAIGRGVPDASVEALRHSTTTLAAVLQDCQSQYREMAETADRHASDTLTLEQSWPANRSTHQ
ncbi:hypothetical protein [Massilia varians]|uniref:hypothetical protein n=1 Tax=Massilia varians TaxID=457921 RepID=UPI002554F04A|nr:hypothetical protein [Massilia varians]MDK6075567.1 hypothetical protein [Massilia varians]